jgi:DNA-binding IclR family transcriptional regulator
VGETACVMPDLRRCRSDAPQWSLHLQRQARLGAATISDLIAGYRAGAHIKELAQQFGVHRNTVTALLHRNGVELRPVGLSPVQVDDARRRYHDGVSLAELGHEFGVGLRVWS